MKLIVFSKKTVVYNSYLSINYNFYKTLKIFNKINENLNTYYKLIFFYDDIANFVSLNSWKSINNWFIKSKKHFLFFFILKQMLFFFLFKKKYLYFNSQENFCFWISNLNKFSKVDFVFILNCMFVTSVGVVTKYFFRFFKFLHFFTETHLPGRKTYRRLSHWMSHIFFKKIKNNIQLNKKHTNKVIFSLVYWAFLMRNYFAKNKLQNVNTQIELQVNEDFFYFNTQTIRLDIKYFNFIDYCFNFIGWWKITTNFPKNFSTHYIVWFLGLQKFTQVNYNLCFTDLLFFKNYNTLFLINNYSSFYINVGFNFNYIENCFLGDVDESIFNANLLEAFEDLDLVDLDLQAVYDGVDYEVENEFNDEDLDEIYMLLEYDPLDIIYKEEDEEEEEEEEDFTEDEDEDEDEDDSIESMELNSLKTFKALRTSSKNYFFDLKRNFLKESRSNTLINYYSSVFGSSNSLDLFFIFYLISYPNNFGKKNTPINVLIDKINSSFYRTPFFNQYIYYNNVYPMFLFPTSIITTLTKKQQVFKNEEFSLFFRHHLGGFLEFFTRKKIFIKIISCFKLSVEVLLFIKQMTTNHMFFQKLVGRGFFLEEMVFIIWQSFYQKDLDFLVTWVQRIMTKIDLHKHRNFLKVFRFILVKYWFFFCSTTQILGFKFDIRGKIGLTGNAKKKNTSFSFGSTSFSTKQNRLEFRQGLVNTETGILGLTFILAF